MYKKQIEYSAEPVNFICKLCGVLHLGIVDESNGYKRINVPPTIITSRDKNQCWFFHCVGCQSK